MPTEEILEKAIYSTEDLAKLFDISYDNMRFLIRKGHIKGVKIGKNWFVTGKSLLKLFEEEADSTEKTSLNTEESEEHSTSLEE